MNFAYYKEHQNVRKKYAELKKTQNSLIHQGNSNKASITNENTDQSSSSTFCKHLNFA